MQLKIPKIVERGYEKKLITNRCKKVILIPARTMHGLKQKECVPHASSFLFHKKCKTGWTAAFSLCGASVVHSLFARQMANSYEARSLDRGTDELKHMGTVVKNRDSIPHVKVFLVIIERTCCATLGPTTANISVCSSTISWNATAYTELYLCNCFFVLFYKSVTITNRTFTGMQGRAEFGKPKPKSQALSAYRS